MSELAFLLFHTINFHNINITKFIIHGKMPNEQLPITNFEQEEINR